MHDPTSKHAIVRFGDYELDRPACELRRQGQRVPLQIQSFRVLNALVDHAGEVVTRATLRDSVWPENVYVDFDHGLNNAINRIRQALGDSGDDPRFIETLPRIGYRFIHAVESNTGTRPTALAARRAPVSTWRKLAAGVAIVAISVGAAGLVYRTAIGTGGMPEETGPKVFSPVAEANDAYFRGLKLLQQRNMESQKLAIQQFQRAIELDPVFALAHAALAEAYAGAGGTTASKFLSVEEARGPALAAAENALRLAPDMGRAHIALARVLNSLQPWSRATDLAIDQAFMRGLELDSANSDGHLQYGNFLSNRNRGKEAMSQFRRARELDPLSPNINSRLGQELMSTGATAEGLDLLKKTVELDPFQYNARMRLAYGYLAVDDLDAAEQQLIAADRISPRSAQSLSTQSLIASRRGDLPRARALLSEVLTLAKSVEDPLSVAIAYVGLKDREPAIEWLTRAVRETRALHRASPWNLQEPMYDWLRDDERFRQLEREIAATAGDHKRSDP